MKNFTRLKGRFSLLTAVAATTLVSCAQAQNPIHTLDWNPSTPAPARLVADDGAINLAGELELSKWSKTSKVEKMTSDSPEVKNVVRVVVETKPEKHNESMLMAKASVDFEKGDEIAISFLMRAPEGDGIARVVFATWEQNPSRFFPKTGNDVTIKDIGKEWRRYSYTFPATKTIGGADTRLMLMFGDKAQTVEVGDLMLKVVGKTGAGGGAATPTKAAAEPEQKKTILTGAQTPGDTTWLSSAKIADIGKIDFFKPGQTWGFLGDSLTHSSSYHQYIQLFLETRYPGRKLWTVNAGRSGDTASGTIRDKRVAFDLKKAAPDIVFIHFGMNDVKYFMFDKTKYTPTDKVLKERQNDYLKNLGAVVDEVKAMGAQPVLLAPTIYENTSGNFPGVNEELAVFTELGQKLAEEKGIPYFDINTPLNRYAEEKRAEKKNWKLTRDDVHPSDEGYQLMSYLILKGLQPQPFVYQVEVDAASQKTDAQGAQISDLKATPKMVSFTLNEKSLPFPVIKADKGLEAVPFEADLNQQTLKVTGLAAGNYAVRIDGKEVAQADAKALGSGIDLAEIESTPQFQQALKVRELILPEKFELERAQRDMASVMFNIDGVDWANADDATGVAAFEKWAATEKGGGWKGYLIGQGKKNFPKRSEIAARLAEIRAELAKMPSEMKHTYEIVPVAGN